VTILFHATFGIELTLKLLILEVSMKTTWKIPCLEPTLISTMSRHLEWPTSIASQIGNHSDPHQFSTHTNKHNSMQLGMQLYLLVLFLRQVARYLCH
jgi:hypothetical protein